MTRQWNFNAVLKICAVLLVLAMAVVAARRLLTPPMPNTITRSFPREFLFSSLVWHLEHHEALRNDRNWTDNGIVIIVFNLGWIDEPPGGYTLKYNRITRTLSCSSETVHWTECFVGMDELRVAAKSRVLPAEFPQKRDPVARSIAFVKLVLCAAFALALAWTVAKRWLKRQSHAPSR